MPAELTFACAVDVEAPLAVVFEHLAHPPNYLGLQPLLVEVTELERRDEPDGRRVCVFRSVEALRLLGFLPYRNPIVTRMVADPQRHRIDCEVHSRPRITVRTAMTLTATETGTTVTDAVTITCPGVLVRYVRAEAERAHRTLLANLQVRLRGTGGLLGF